MKECKRKVDWERKKEKMNEQEKEQMKGRVERKDYVQKQTVKEIRKDSREKNTKKKVNVIKGNKAMNYRESYKMNQCEINK